MKCVLLHESGRKIRIRIPQIRMSSHEADVIEYYLKSLSSVKDVSVNDRTCDAIVTFKESSQAGKPQVVEALEAFSFQSYEDQAILALVPEETGREMNRYYEEKIVGMVIRRFLKSIFLPVPVNIAITVAQSIPFIGKGIRSLAQGRLEVSVLDATAIGASMLQGNFSTASSIMFLLKIGENLEEWTRKRSINALARSMSLNIDKVWMVSETGEEILADIRQIRKGDRIIVRSSDVIPLDGIVISGEMTVNQASMTGESEPVGKSEGSYVYAGTVVEEGSCRIRVVKEHGTGKYDQIVHMIEESEKLKSSTEARAYKLADKLVPFSFAGAGLAWLLTRNVTKALAFMMVDFSCAMKLSMPLAVLSAMKEAGSHSITVKGGKFLEAVAQADTVVFDKTGTLTYATPKLVEITAFGDRDPDELLKMAACLEEHYPHSVANAIVQSAEEKGLKHEEMHSKLEYVIAHGVCGYINGERVVIGSEHFTMEDEKCILSEEERCKLDQMHSEYSKLFMGQNGKLVAVFHIFDPIREDAPLMIRQLRELGISKICMMTGDSKKTARIVAEQLGLDLYQAEVLPEDKTEFIKKEHKLGRKVIMIGDGINDSPALSEADAGVAISDGAAIAREVADITIASEDLAEIVNLVRISRALMDRINSNYRFIWSFNSVLIFLGVMGILPPAASALFHNASTIITAVKSMTNLLEKDE